MSAEPTPVAVCRAFALVQEGRHYFVGIWLGSGRPVPVFTNALSRSDALAELARRTGVGLELLHEAAMQFQPGKVLLVR